MKQKTKKILKAIASILLNIVGIRYPQIEEAIKESIDEIEELKNLKNLN